MRFKVGDYVVLRKNSPFYNNGGELNDAIGTIRAVHPEGYYKYSVSMPDGYIKLYSEEDLDFAKVQYLRKYREERKRLFGE